MSAGSPPASDADLSEWAAWARSRGLGHLDPARLRAEAARMRAWPAGHGLGEPVAAEDPEEARPVLTVDLGGPLGIYERVTLAAFLRETAMRAAAGSAGADNPVVMAVRQLAAAVEAATGGAVSVRLRGVDRAAVHQLLLTAAMRAESESLPVAPLARRAQAAAEHWAFGPKGWQPERQPRLGAEPPGMWSSDEPFRATG